MTTDNEAPWFYVKTSNNNYLLDRCWFFVICTGFLKSKSRSAGKCADFWRAEKRFRFWIRHTVKTQWFYWFVIVLVLFNTICVAVEHYKQPKWLTSFLCKFLFSKYRLFYVFNITSKQFISIFNVITEVFLMFYNIVLS